MRFYTVNNKNPIHIFYHVYQVKNWEILYQEQIHALYVSGLMNECTKLHIGVVGNIPLFYVPDNAEVTYHQENNGETDTLKMVRDFCIDNECRVMFFHTKGVSKGDRYSNSWRLFMEYFIVHKWRECIEYLNEYDCCGCNWTIETSWGQFPHFSGTFWWATSGHIRTLEDKWLEVKDEVGNRYNREFWIGSSFFKGHVKVKELWNSGLNLKYDPQHYWMIYPESEYIK